MGKASYQQLLDGLSLIDAPAEVKRQVENLIRNQAAADGVAMSFRNDRMQFARHLFDARTARSVIRDRLMRRFDVSESQAYRDINDALAIGPQSSQNQA
jgi:hypothetical protein